MKSFLLATIIILSLASCDLFTKKKNDSADAKQQMMDADKAFSKLSEEKGMKAAFIEYIDSNGVLLRANEMPVIGADAIDYLIQQNDSTYTLKWAPSKGVIAESGELGYTYGLYQLQSKIKDTVIFGTYVSIWKKQSDGSWKFVLDSGNEGVGEPQ